MMMMKAYCTYASERRLPCFVGHNRRRLGPDGGGWRRVDLGLWRHVTRLNPSQPLVHSSYRSCPRFSAFRIGIYGLVSHTCSTFQGKTGTQWCETEQAMLKYAVKYLFHFLKFLRTVLNGVFIP